MEDNLLNCNVGNNTKIDFSGCNICGDLHKTHECYFLTNFQYIRDSKTTTRARQTLPKDLEITRMADGTTSVIAKRSYQRGMTFGPFEAKRNWAMNPAINFAIKIFEESINDTYYLDYSDEDTSNWMCFIPPATNAKEQNLICYQSNQEIYYTVMREIPVGEELRVWYAPYYAQKMKIPLHVNNRALPPLQPITADEKDSVEILDVALAQDLADRLPPTKLGAKDEKKIWTCRICSMTINSVVAYAKHQMNHYKPLVGTICIICNKKFPNFATLERHRVDCHSLASNEENIVGIPTTANQQQQNAATILNMSEQFMTEKENHDLSLLDSSINTNDLLHHTGSLIENSSLKSILENQCLNMNVSSMADSILSEHISSADSVKFNVEELSSELLDITPDDEEKISENSTKNFDCDICGKKFLRVHYLYRHLRKHTGEFICSTCLCVFARKENLVSHVCAATKSQSKGFTRYQCSYCPKNFAREKYLKNHITRHSELHRCRRCRQKFSTRSELDSHKCGSPKQACGQCGKKFFNAVYLKRHIKRHNETPKAQKKKKAGEEILVICEICGDIFKNLWSLQQHQKSHGEKAYECEICNRRFHRIGVLKQHKFTHQSAELPCNVCGKKFKSKRALDVHVLLHGNKKYQCDKCDKSFFQKYNYLKHYKQIHAEKVLHSCPHCSLTFMSESAFNKHVAGHDKNLEGFPCDVCKKFFHTQAKVARHMQTCHSGIIYRCPFCKSTVRHRHSLRRHFEKQHKDLTDEWSKPGFYKQLEEKSTVGNSGKSPDEAGTSDQILVKQQVAEDVTEHVEATDEVAKSIAEPVAAEFSENLNTVQEIQGTENIQDLMQNVKSDDLEVNSQLLNDVPQLRIDSDSQLAETVLNNTYIFGEDGDFVFYVLDNNTILGS
ncbi:PR domain zinc finger protein 15-like [Cotesia glomerata]|uniref:Uncharacterized protein n=1 Tax=Cotesia glomerata TaxID=32391 RepID=A0AAV7IE09_COTGL|nr:PR domain zinc finger protein 15-like [Cotesia glomerata]XP_044577217.1 PR domain zinc finger protein 15-like [Cotesia glomerata]KAH0549382.1 hypothetical protein KQX54_008826 [Cotesia glomerata]